MKYARRFFAWIALHLALSLLFLSVALWLLDGVVLRAANLDKAFQSKGTYALAAEALPKLVLDDQGGERKMTEAELVLARVTLSEVVDQEYVQAKVSPFMTNVLGFVREGQPRPTLDLTDLPARFAAQDDRVPFDFTDQFDTPIDIATGNAATTFNQIRDGYSLFALAKYIIPAGALLVLAACLALTESGRRLRRLGWIFVSVSVWGFFWWLILMRLPEIISPKVKAETESADVAGKLVMSVVEAAASLVTPVLLLIGVIGGLAAVIVLVISIATSRRRSHGDAQHVDLDAPVDSDVASTSMLAEQQMGADQPVMNKNTRTKSRVVADAPPQPSQPATLDQNEPTPDSAEK